MFNKDAFSNGQIDSKLWLCRELESLNWTSNLTHIYGGWYGVLAFMLLSREKFKVDRIESFDIDPSCKEYADAINENWIVKNGRFSSYTLDCNQEVPGIADLVINTSTEHFEGIDWFNELPRGTRVILQGTNMPHDDHYVCSNNLQEFIDCYKLQSIVYKGTLDFDYRDWKFSRHMVIGIK